MKKLKSTVKNMLIASWESACFCFKHAPLRYFTLVVCEIAFSVLPFAALFLWQRIINTLTDNGVVSSVWGLAALYVSIAILRLSLETFNAFTDKMASETMDNIRHAMIFEKTCFA
jgi:uncharacterized membrane protein